MDVSQGRRQSWVSAEGGLRCIVKLGDPVELSIVDNDGHIRHVFCQARDLIWALEDLIGFLEANAFLKAEG